LEIRDTLNDINTIISDTKHPHYPKDIEQTEETPAITTEQQVQDIGRMLFEITDFLMQGSAEMKKVRYILNFTADLIRTKIIPLFGELSALYVLLGEVERNRKKTAINFETALEYYKRAYSIAESMIDGNLMFDMSVGDFFVEPDPCKKKSQDTEEDPCDFETKYGGILYLNIEKIFHKPPADVRKARILNFIPSLDRDFIVHGDKWSRDYGRTWSEWNQCIGPCSGCFANPADTATPLENIVIGTNTDTLWENNLWVFEYQIKQGAWTVLGANMVWSEKNEWFYDYWGVKHNVEWYDQRLKEINAIENNLMRRLMLDYLVGGIQYNDGIYYLMTLGGVLIKEIITDASAGEAMNNQRFRLKFDPPPNMIRDNTQRKEDLEKRLSELQDEMKKREEKPEDTQQLQEEYNTLKEFYDNIPLSELYHETYQFNIILSGSMISYR